MKKFSAQRLYELMMSKLLSLDVSQQDAHHIADCLMQTSLYGIDTHGVRLFRYYVSELEGGRAKIHPNIRFEREMPVGGLLDSDHSSGIIGGIAAMNYAIEKAKQVGISAIAVKNGNHYGCASNYSRMAAEQGLIGISMSNTDALVALQGCSEAFLGTNPIAVSISGQDGEVFNLDFTTSQTAYSRVMMHLDNGEPIESGWAIDKQGVDSAKSGEVHALQGLGGYKGQGMGLMVQMLTSVICGMPFDNELSHFYSAPFDQGRGVSFFFMAIDPNLFIDPKDYKQRVSELMKSARSLSPEIILPGDKEAKIEIERREHGIELAPDDEKYFDDLQTQFAPQSNCQ